MSMRWIQFLSFANFTKLIKSDGLKILLMLFSRAVVVALVYRSAGHGFEFRQMKTYMQHTGKHPWYQIYLFSMLLLVVPSEILHRQK